MQNSFVSNGCTIEGSVENCVIGRGTTLKKGAVVKNCVILPGVTIGENVRLENVVVDKNAHIFRKKDLVGELGNPLYVKRDDKI